MYFLKVLVDIGTCICLMFVVKKVCEFLFYRYLSGIDHYKMERNDLTTLLVILGIAFILFFIGCKLSSNNVTKVLNLVGFIISIVVFVMLKWKRGDTGEHVLMTYLPSLISVMIMEFLLMAR